jgi:hypothetical protein
MEIFHVVIIGIASCVVMDVWQRLLKLLYSINPSDWSVVGRWFVLVVLERQIYNPTIDQVAPIKNELMIGWIVHYSVAILYSIFFFILLEYGICSASLINGIIFGLISVVVPWFFFMPVLGKGFLGMKTSSPLMACSLAVGSHIAIGASIGGFYQIFGY